MNVRMDGSITFIVYNLLLYFPVIYDIRRNGVKSENGFNMKFSYNLGVVG